MIRTYFKDRRGAAAVEFALFLTVFTVALPSVVDIGIYAYDDMQVQNSAQMGVQAVWATCAVSFEFPATDSTVCSNAQTALDAAVQRTSLGSKVTVSSVSEGYYCTNGSGVLANAAKSGKTGDFTTALDSAVSPAPTDCSNVTGAETSAPGDYFSATVTYTYTPVFGGVSVAKLLGSTITATSWVRLQ